MDSYREIMVEDQRSTDDRHGDDGFAGGNDVGQEFSPGGVGQNERRMQVRAYNHWASLLGTRNFPRIGDLDAAGMPGFAENAVVLDFSASTENPAVTMLGRKLAEECGAATTILRLGDIPGGSLLSRITDRYMQILTNQAPVGFEAEFINQNGRTVVYRGILLPFASDGETIQHVLGVINWKELADAATTAGLFRELHGDAGNSGLLTEQMLIVPPLGGWADGPAAASHADQDHAPVSGGDPKEWLDAARELADAARDHEELGRTALYRAIGRAWDLACMAEAEPGAFHAIVTAAGLDVPENPSLATAVKVVFGAVHDRVRRSEILLALQYARRQGLAAGALADHLAKLPGGVNSVICHDRGQRRSRRRHTQIR